ncbi:hypothetical protein M5D96_008003, partial [Drosophila gunungcola]
KDGEAIPSGSLGTSFKRVLQIWLKGEKAFKDAALFKINE